MIKHNSLRYEMTVDDQVLSQSLRITGRLSLTKGGRPALPSDPRFVYSETDWGLAFSGQVSYQAIDFMPQDIFVVKDFYPKPLSMDLPCDFKAALHSPRQSALATGKLENGAFSEQNVRSFALVLSDTFPCLEDSYQGIDLRCLHYPENPALARTVLAHAREDLAQCKRLFGFFPYQALTFTPACTQWRGGCPLATGVLGLHHRPLDQVLMGDNWIITHEICHEYWGEYVKDAEPTGWLGIGLGLATDFELSEDKALHHGDQALYRQACEKGLRTAIDIPMAEFEQLMASPGAYDYNSAVIHGKSGAIMAKIKGAIGKDAFFKALSALLRDRAGQSVDREAFLAAIKKESGRDFSAELAHWLATDACIL